MWRHDGCLFIGFFLRHNNIQYDTAFNAGQECTVNFSLASWNSAHLLPALECCMQLALRSCAYSFHLAIDYT